MECIIKTLYYNHTMTFHTILMQSQIFQSNSIIHFFTYFRNFRLFFEDSLWNKHKRRIKVELDNAPNEKHLEIPIFNDLEIDNIYFESAKERSLGVTW